MTQEVFKYPYNARQEDEIKVFLSDIICEQVVKVNCRNGQFFCIIKDKVTSKNKEIILSAGIIFAVLFNIALDARVTDELEFDMLEDSNQKVILAKNNSSSPTIRPGVASGFLPKPQINHPAGAGGVKPTTARGLSTPRGLITSKPLTQAHRQRTRLSRAGNPGSAGGELIGMISVGYQISNNSKNRVLIIRILLKIEKKGKNEINT